MQEGEGTPQRTEKIGRFVHRERLEKRNLHDGAKRERFEEPRRATANFRSVGKRGRP